MYKSKKQEPKKRGGGKQLRTVSNADLTKLLRGGPSKALTRSAIAKKLRCTFNTAKRSVERLEEEGGVRVRFVLVREGEAGPESKAFYVE